MEIVMHLRHLKSISTELSISLRGYIELEQNNGRVLLTPDQAENLLEILPDAISAGRRVNEKALNRWDEDDVNGDGK